MSTSVGPAPPATPRSPGARRDVRRAWVSLALLPIAFVLAMLVGEGLLALQGYDSGTAEPLPLTVVLSASAPAVLVLIAPGVAAVLFGLRALRHGAPTGLTPAVIGGVLALGLVAQNVLAYTLG